ncbi:MAG: hypothetical protein ACI9JZ_000150, partial [Lentimonas sp.]
RVPFLSEYTIGNDEGRRGSEFLSTRAIRTFGRAQVLRSACAAFAGCSGGAFCCTDSRLYLRLQVEINFQLRCFLVDMERFLHTVAGIHLSYEQNTF